MKGKEGTSLKQLLQGMVGEGVEVLQGTVKSVEPLQIQIAGDEKLTVGQNNTYVPGQLTDHEVEVSWEEAEERRTVTVHNALKAGESVHVLSFSHGKQYYVLGRVG